MVSNIWVAAADNQVQIVESHLASGNFTPNSKDPNGYTPMHAAASYGHTNLLKLLVSKGGDINIQDNEGDTPLHHVESLKTAKCMVESLKADFKLKNSEGQTAAEFIEEEDEFPELAQYLRSLVHDQPTESTELAPETFDGHQVRYTMQEEGHEDTEEDIERRKKLEAIVNSENPEEALRELVTSAVREGMALYRDSSEPESKRQK